MSNARRVRRQDRRPRAAGSEGPQLIRGAEDLLADPALTSTDMPCRLTYLDDPVFGSMQPAVGVSPEGTLITDSSGTEEPIPVILFEPVKVIMSENKTTGLVTELRTEAIVACGFHRVPPPASVWAAEPAAGWELLRQPGQLALRDASGDIWASAQVTPDPRWVSAAASRRHVIVFYGPQLGVRAPAGKRPAQYTTAARAAEFRAARSQGLVSVATVPWNGEAPDGTLGWLTLLPGSFGQPLPAIFVPEFTFARHGGPAMFGLTRVAAGGHGPETGFTRNVVARVTRTDIDLMNPAEDRQPRWIGGVSYPGAIDAAWARAARRRRLALLVTGPRLPAATPATRHQPVSARDELWAAVIPVTPA
jgi:hypothetical protein